MWKIYTIIGLLIGGLLMIPINGSAEKDAASLSAKTEKAIFAGGCFWCMQPPFDKLKGVLSTNVGYIGGKTEKPDYDQVCSGTSGHAEAVEVFFDPAQISYSDLLEVFWKNIDPTTTDGQFADMGSQYRTAIFYFSEDQRLQAEASKQQLEQTGKYGGKRIVTQIVPATEFYPAEDYHQKYYRKNPFRYQMYKHGSGREDYIQNMWGTEEKKSKIDGLTGQ